MKIELGAIYPAVSPGILGHTAAAQVTFPANPVGKTEVKQFRRFLDTAAKQAAPPQENQTAGSALTNKQAIATARPSKDPAQAVGERAPATLDVVAAGAGSDGSSNLTGIRQPIARGTPVGPKGLNPGTEVLGPDDLSNTLQPIASPTTVKRVDRTSVLPESEGSSDTPQTDAAASPTDITTVKEEAAQGRSVAVAMAKSASKPAAAAPTRSALGSVKGPTTKPVPSAGTIVPAIIPAAAQQDPAAASDQTAPLRVPVPTSMAETRSPPQQDMAAEQPGQGKAGMEVVTTTATAGRPSHTAREMAKLTSPGGPTSDTPPDLEANAFGQTTTTPAVQSQSTYVAPVSANVPPPTLPRLEVLPLPDAAPKHPIEVPIDGSASRPSDVSAQASPILLALGQRSGTQTLSLRLTPVELGQLHIRIDRAADGAANVSLTAERPETLRLLVRDQAQLHRALDQAGVPAEARSVTFHLAGAAMAQAPTIPVLTAGLAPDAGSGPSTSRQQPLGGEGFGDPSSAHNSRNQEEAWTAGSLTTSDADDVPGAEARPWIRAGINITA